jgi:hypothetical protein
MTTIRSVDDYHDILSKASMAYEKSQSGVGRLGCHYELIDLLRRKCGIRADRNGCVTTALFYINEFARENGFPEVSLHNLA